MHNVTASPARRRSRSFLRSTARLLLRVLVAIVVIVPLLVLGLLGALQTEAGRNAVVALVNDIAGGPDGGVRLAGLQVGWGLDASVERVEVSDAAGTYLTVEQARLAWHPLALLSGTIDVEAIDVARVSLARLPVPSKTQSDTGGSVPLLPFRLGQARIAEIDIAAPVVGTPVRLTAQAQASLSDAPQAANAELAVSRIDGTPGDIAATVRFMPQAEELFFDVTVKEPRGGLAARLLQIEGLPALDVALKGDGPLDDWQAQMTLALDGRTEIAGTARLAETGDTRQLTARLEGELSALAPPVAAALVMGRTVLDAEVILTRDFAPRRAQGTLETGTLSSSFRADLPEDGRIDASADMRLSAGDGAMIGVELPDRLITIGETTLSLTASGPRDALDWSLALDSARVQTTEAQLEGIGLRLAGEGLDTTAADAPLGLTAKLTARHLQPLIEGADMLAGPLTLDARATVDPAAPGAKIDALTLTLNGIETTFDGTVTAETVDGSYTVTLADLARFAPQVVGAARIEGTAKGALTGPDIAATLTAEALQLAGKPVTDLEVDVTATTAPDALSANIQARGSIDGNRLDVEIDAEPKGAGVTIPTFSLATGENRITGAFEIGDLADALGTVTGSLDIAAPKLSELSTLALTELEGALAGKLALTGTGADQRAQLTLQGEDIAVAGNRIARLSASGTARGGFAAPTLSGEARLSGITAGGTAIETVTATATTQGTRTDIELDARLSQGTNADGVTLTAALQPTDSGLDVLLSSLQGRYRGLATRLAQEARISIADGTTTIENLGLRIGEGRIDVSGTAGDRLAIDARINALPLTALAPLAPGVSPTGSASGTVTVRGAAADPQAEWSLSVANLSAAPLRENGLAAVGLRSTGRFQGGRVTQTTDITGADGLALTAAGTVAIAAPGALDITLSGNVPVAAARQRLILSGFSGQGGLAVSGRVTGSFAAPRYSITLQPRQLSLTQLASGLTLQNFTGSIAVDNSGVAINDLNAAIAAGGNLSAGGRIGLDGGMPADLRVQVRDGRYSDGRVVQATLSADLRLTGPLADQARGARLEGNVTVARADITIPSSLPGAINPLAVTHVNAPEAVRLQDAALARDEGRSGGGGSRPISLDVNVSAPGRIFVRGRGLDAEMGGTLRIVGTTADPQAVGSFNMRRGLMQVLTRRVQFNRGDVSFTGSLMPRLDFAATSQTSSAQVTISVTGPAAQPDIAFTSSPQLPQDEVLAQFLFDRSMSQLSPTQIAQLGASVLALTGGSGEGPLGALRQSLGVDAIDLETDGTSGPSLAVGKYLSDNIYLGVRQGTEAGSSRVTVDIDVTKSLKLRGEVGADGESKAGIFFEREFGK